MVVRFMIPAMLKHGILNPHILELLARVRHTNTLVISDWAFPYWPEIQTIDISLTHGIPTVLDVFELIRPVFEIGTVMQASEFLDHNPPDVIARHDSAMAGLNLERLPHDAFKTHVPKAIGLIRTGDATIYGNLILQSA